MPAAVVTRYGAPEVVKLRGVPRPALGPRDLLIRVKATSVSSGDARMRAARVPEGMGPLLRLAAGWNAPRSAILGGECAGIVEAVGSDATRFRVGEPVVAFTGLAMGAHAAFVRIREDGAVARKPERIGWTEAAALLFGGTTAFHYLHRAARLKAGERVLVVGATGAVGSAAIQLARLAGAEVTAVCSGANGALALSLGAARVIDYQQTDFTCTGASWDVVMDCVGATDYARCRPVLAPGGRLLRVVCGLAGQFAAPFQGRLSGHRVIAGIAQERAEDVRHLLDLAQRGALRAVVDGVLPFERIAEAHARVDSGRKRGSLILTLG